MANTRARVVSKVHDRLAGSRYDQLADQGMLDHQCLGLRIIRPVRFQIIIKNQRLRATKANPFCYLGGVGVLADCVSPLQSETLPGPQRQAVAGRFSASWAGFER